MTLTIPNVSVLIIFTVSAIRLSGFNVLSDEYSNPSFITLTFSTFPIVLDCGTITASFPIDDPTIPRKIGSFL